MNPPDAAINPLNAELYRICHLLALLGAHHFFHIGKIRVNYRLIVCRLDTAEHVSGILMLIIRILLTAVAASGLP
jgi:hypothetical protein